MREDGRSEGAPDGGGAPARRIARWLRRPVSIVVIASAVVLFLLLHPKSWGPINWAFGRGAPRRAMLPGLVAAATFAALPLLYRFVRSEAAAWRRLAVLIVLGVGLHWSLLVAEGRGTRAMADLLWKSGHSEFVKTARDQDLAGLTGRYEELARVHGWTFARSKPPGCLLVYAAIVGLADSPLGAALAPIYSDPPPPSQPAALRDWWIEGVMFTLLPLLTFLTIVPLFFLTRDLVGPRAADLAALFYVTVPSVLTIPMHLDSALYPLLGATAAALTLRGARRGRAWQVAAGGAVASAGVFVSFSLLPIVPLVGALPLLAALEPADEPRARRLGRALGLAAWWAAGLAAVHLLLAAALDYDAVTRYRSAMAFHEQWWPDDPKWLLGSPVQFFVWIGVPFTAALAVEAVHAAHPRRLGSAASLFVLGALVLIAITDAIGHTRAESERLWLFWAPLLMVPAAARIERWEAAGGPRVVPVLLAIQLATAFIIKIHFTP
jgi:hypothetical protein